VPKPFLKKKLKSREKFIILKIAYFHKKLIGKNKKIGKNNKF
jgi:hypothetical protein